MPKLPAPNQDVHCHLCPLKDFCKWAQPTISYKYQKFFEKQERRFTTTKEEDTLLHKATINCPLRRIILP